MPTVYQDTALLVFSRSARADALSKPLAETPAAAFSVAKILIGHTRMIAQKTGLPVFWITEKRQYGATFGEKLANTFESLFARGYARVIAIGNDCPALAATDILAAAAHLRYAGMVSGPTGDGGVYLIGLSRKTYKRRRFLAVRWQTASVYDDLGRLFSGAHKRLAEKADFDSPGELRAGLQHGKLPGLLKIRLLQVLSAPLPTSFRPVFPYVEVVRLGGAGRRAPPAA